MSNLVQDAPARFALVSLAAVALIKAVTVAQAATNPATAETAAVVFPSGNSVSVQFRQTPPVVALPDRPTARENLMLVRPAAAEGDGLAAFTTFRILDFCSRAYENEQALNVAVATLHESQRLQTAEMDSPVPVSGVTDVDALADSALRQPYEKCRGITPAEKAEAVAWLRKSADAGYHWGLIEYARRQGQTPEAEQAWLRAWSSGYMRALAWLSELHRDDPVRAYAEYFLFVRLSGAWAGNSEDRQRYSRHDRRVQELARREQLLTRQQVDEATRLAEDILAHNSACCYTR